MVTGLRGLHVTFPSLKNNGCGSCRQPAGDRNTARSHSDKHQRSGASLRSSPRRISEAYNILLSGDFLKLEVRLSTSPTKVLSRQELRHPSQHRHGTVLVECAWPPK